MTMNISDLPEYGPAQAAYQAAKREAESSGDPARVATVEQEWRGTVLDLREKAMERDQQSAAVATAREKAKREYPKAPEAVFAALTDPAAIEAAAKSAHEAIEAATPQAPAGQAQQQGGSWGSPAPASASGAATGTGQQKTLDEFKAELAPSVLRGLPGAADNERFRKGIFRTQIASRFDFNQQPPGNQPAGQ